ncbi:hypothetical protein K2X85_20215 [bacterium]|jgi:hypothetical protein|nr:hypothetical protein [bacterium]
MDEKLSINIPESLEGWSCELRTSAERSAILPCALDYRGDVTITCMKHGPVTGYVFDVNDDDLTMLRPDQMAPTQIPVERIVRIDFSGRNAAHGRSWEAWLEKVAQAESRGEVAELYPDDLDESSNH